MPDSPAATFPPSTDGSKRRKDLKARKENWKAGSADRKSQQEAGSKHKARNNKERRSENANKTDAESNKVEMTADEKDAKRERAKARERKQRRRAASAAAATTGVDADSGYESGQADTDAGTDRSSRASGKSTAARETAEDRQFRKYITKKYMSDADRTAMSEQDWMKAHGSDAKVKAAREKMDKHLQAKAKPRAKARAKTDTEVSVASEAEGAAEAPVSNLPTMSGDTAAGSETPSEFVSPAISRADTAAPVQPEADTSATSMPFTTMGVTLDSAPTSTGPDITAAPTLTDGGEKRKRRSKERERERKGKRQETAKPTDTLASGVSERDTRVTSTMAPGSTAAWLDTKPKLFQRWERVKSAKGVLGLKAATFGVDLTNMSPTQRSTIRSELLSDFASTQMTDGGTLFDWAGRAESASRIFAGIQHQSALETMTGQWAEDRVKGFKGFGKRRWGDMKVGQYTDAVRDAWAGGATADVPAIAVTGTGALAPDTAPQGGVGVESTVETGPVVTALENGEHGWRVAPGPDVPPPPPPLNATNADSTISTPSSLANTAPLPSIADTSPPSGPAAPSAIDSAASAPPASTAPLPSAALAPSSAGVTGTRPALDGDMEDKLDKLLVGYFKGRAKDVWAEHARKGRSRGSQTDVGTTGTEPLPSTAGGKGADGKSTVLPTSTIDGSGGTTVPASNKHTEGRRKTRRSSRKPKEQSTALPDTTLPASTVLPETTKATDITSSKPESTVPDSTVSPPSTAGAASTVPPESTIASDRSGRPRRSRRSSTGEAGSTDGRSSGSGRSARTSRSTKKGGSQSSEKREGRRESRRTAEESTGKGGSETGKAESGADTSSVASTV